MKTSATKIVPTDCYFKNENGLISEWQIDRDNYIEYALSMYFYAALIGSFCECFPLGCAICPIVKATEYILCAKPNIEDLVNAQHVCLTDDGVTYIIDKHKSGCRCHCQDVGKVTHLLSFEKITDVSVEEPAGAEWCGLVPKVLYTVTIQTAGSPVMIVGLKDALNFKKEVMRVKKEKEVNPMMEMMRMMQQQQMMNMPQSGQQQQMMMPQGGQQMMYAQQAGQPQMYAQQAGQPQMYAQQAGQPQMYAQQAGQPNTMHFPQMVYAQPVPMEMDRGMK